MIRKLFAIMTVCCVVVVLIQVGAAGWFWFRGTLNGETLREAGGLLTGREAEEEVEDDSALAMQPSTTEVIKERSLRVLELNARVNEFNALNATITRTREDVIRQNQELAAKEQAFQQRLDAVQAQLTTEAADEARGILLAMPPENAADSLLKLTLAENVALLKGMSPKSVAALLEALAARADGIERGQEIFAAISQGEPTIQAVSATRADLGAGPAPARQ
jgi:flagellar motility protein MotE (MotC chaperone)